MASTLSRVDRPVVVAPDTASKNASTKLKPAPVMGMVISSEVSRKTKAIRTRDSFICGLVGLTERLPNPNAPRMATTTAYRAERFHAPKTKDTPKGTIVSTAKGRHRVPRYLYITAGRTEYVKALSLPEITCSPFSSHLS
jgi:hypothetical protein